MKNRKLKQSHRKVINLHILILAIVTSYKPKSKLISLRYTLNNTLALLQCLL